MNNIKYISSSLEIIEEKKEHNHSSNNQIVINNKVYAVLTPNVYAWLRRQMEKAHSAYKTGKMAEASWNTLRQRFRPVHDWAIETWGKEVIAQSLKKNQPNPFIDSNRTGEESNPAIANTKEKPPVSSRSQNNNYLYPASGEYPCIHPVSPRLSSR